MLILTLTDQLDKKSLHIGNDIKVSIDNIKGGRVKLIIDLPTDIDVFIPEETSPKIMYRSRKG